MGVNLLKYILFQQNLNHRKNRRADTFWPLWTDLGTDAKENLATLKDNNGWTLMHVIAEHQDSETFDYIWLRLKKETQKKLIPIKTEEGYMIAELVKSYAELSEETMDSLGITPMDAIEDEDY